MTTCGFSSKVPVSAHLSTGVSAEHAGTVIGELLGREVRNLSDEVVRPTTVRDADQGRLARSRPMRSIPAHEPLVKRSHYVTKRSTGA